LLKGYLTHKLAIQVAVCLSRFIIDALAKEGIASNGARFQRIVGQDRRTVCRIRQNFFSP
jgi:hypothetical protein